MNKRPQGPIPTQEASGPSGRFFAFWARFTQDMKSPEDAGISSKYKIL